MLSGVVVTILFISWGLGGLINFGRPLIWSTWTTALIMVMFAIWWGCKAAPRRLALVSLAPMPWLGYVTVHHYFVTPAPWFSQAELAVWAQAATLFFIVVNVLTSRRQLYGLIGMTVFTALVVLLAAFYQYSINPEWLPLDRVLTSNEGRVTGTFGAPNGFAAILLLILPLLLSFALMRRFQMPLRIACGAAAALFMAGILISMSRGACLALLIVVALSPLMLFERGRTRIKFWAWSLVLLTVGGTLLWFFNPMLQQRIERGMQQGGEVTRPVMWETALAMFRDSPVVGQGSGSFGFNWDRFRPGGGILVSETAHSDYLQVLAEYGTIGFLLLFVPVAWIIWTSWRVWLSTPFQRINAEAAFRGLHHNVHGLTEDQLKQHEKVKRRPAKTSLQPAPSRKIMLAGFILGFIGFGIHMIVESHLELASLIFVSAVLLALALRFGGASERKLEGRWIKVCGISAALLWAGMLFSIGYQTFHQTWYYFTGYERLSSARDQELGVEARLVMLEQAETELQFVTALRADHADALAGLGRLYLLRATIEPYDAVSLAEKAEISLREAIDILPDHWSYWANLARSLQILQGSDGAVEDAYMRSIELAPHSPVPWYYLSDYLSKEPGRRREALAAADRSLELYPHFGPAQEVKRRLALSGAP